MTGQGRAMPWPLPGTHAIPVSRVTCYNTALQDTDVVPRAAPMHNIKRTCPHLCGHQRGNLESPPPPPAGHVHTFPPHSLLQRWAPWRGTRDTAGRQDQHRAVDSSLGAGVRNDAWPALPPTQHTHAHTHTPFFFLATPSPSSPHSLVMFETSRWGCVINLVAEKEFLLRGAGRLAAGAGGRATPGGQGACLAPTAARPEPGDECSWCCRI